MITAIGRDKALATLNTLAATTVTSSSAVFNGKITFEGTPPYTTRGFVYSTSSMPTLENTISNLTVQVNTTTDFSATASNLTVGQTYHVRVYAINTTGTAYSSNEVLVTPSMSLPQVSTQNATDKNLSAGTITLNGTIVSVGDPAYTERGFVYGLVHNPTVDDNTKKIVSGSGAGIFSSNLTGLTTGNLYYVRAYATNSQGTAYGTEISFSTAAVLATLSTDSVDNVNRNLGSARFNGTILTLGDPPYTERGFVYGLVHNPTIEDDTKKTVSGSVAGAFSSNITGLVINNLYYVRAYATNVGGIVYGNEITCDLNAVSPTLTTEAVSNIVSTTTTTATFNGTIVSIGDPAYTERGFVYGTNPNPTITDTKVIVSGEGTGQFLSNVTGLTTQTTYYVRAYAIANNTTFYGTQVNFALGYYVMLQASGLMVQATDITGNSPGYLSTVNSLCDNSTLAGYTDWRLPTQNELAILYNNRIVIGGFTTSGTITYYWSSTVYNNSSGHWVQDFSSGAQNVSYDGSNGNYRGRCVRNY
jgi:hypothetical protein